MKAFLVALHFLAGVCCSFSLVKGESNEVPRDISDKSLPASFSPTNNASRSIVSKGTSAFVAKVHQQREETKPDLWTGVNSKERDAG